ncbi:MAG: glycoside hydrolase family 3 C-terminal domain-containing protein [Lachnospiraceae bacterium]|nr:glycoside hydrolase family 3 C-terminal domain-containing protein [Lachnospiraceae bacterium]
MKHKDIIDKMTLEEKAAFLGGKGEWQTWDFPRLGIPEMYLSDGPSGVRRQAGAGDHLGLNPSLPATCVPSAATVASSWDVELAGEIGKTLGEEAMCENVQVLLGPGMNMKRSPLCGRNFEYYSEDPYLAGKMASGYIKGVQSQGVRACAKHFAVNSQEERRMAVNAVVDERTLREIYLTQFEISVREGGVKAVMTSYNEVNGEYTNENEHLLKDILRGEWGYDGMVVTDWGGSNSHVAGVKAGSDLEMPAPGLDSARQLIAAVNDGALSMEELDARVDTLLEAVLSTTEAAKGHKEEFDKEAHNDLARKAASQCAILLKNEDRILPLKKGTKVVVVGDFAYVPRYQGAGSSSVNNTFLENITDKLGDYAEEIEVTGMVRGYKRDGSSDETLKAEAVAAAKNADVVLYFFGLNEMSESEGLDRTHIFIPQNMVDVLKAMAEANPNIVGVLSGGSPIDMAWDKDLKAILHGYLTGQAGGGAILDILTGRVNPSGKLAETYPVRYEDTPAYSYYPARERNTNHKEGPYIGYRYFDTAGIPVKYPFGFGLSYTTFAYSDLAVSGEGVSFTITNTGDRDGAEAAQLYVSLPGAKVFRPRKELKGFAKVFLKAGESKKVEIPFDEYTFRYWNVKTGRWEIEGGSYEILVGASVEDIRLSGRIDKAATTDVLPYDPAKLPSYYKADIKNVSDGEFSELLGYPVPDGSWGSVLTENDAICQLKNAKLGLARFGYNILEGKRKKAEAAGTPDLNILFIYNMPFRAIAKMTGGAVSKDMVDGMVTAVNGHFFKGIGKVIGGYFANSSANKKYEKKIRGEK